MRILYIDIDSLRPDHLGCYGYHRNTSPAIDSIASEGTKFTMAFTPDAPCLPSRTAFYSGRYGISTGVVGHGGSAAQPKVQGPNRGFRDWFDEQGLARQLQKAGYHTAMISPFGQRHAAHWFYAGFNEIHNTGKGGMESAEEVMPVVDAWVKENFKKDNWYLHLNLWDPHTPYRTPENYKNPFENEPLPAWLADGSALKRHIKMVGPHTALDFGGMYDDKVPAQYPKHPGKIDDMAQLKKVIDGYDMGVRYADEQVGKIVKALKDAGVYEDTMIIISADHGENFGELGIYGEHATADQGTCRIPMIIKGPGLVKGKTQEDYILNIDLAPTLMDLLKKQKMPIWDGQSFAENLTGKDKPLRQEVIVSQCAHVCQRSVRWGKWLYMRTYHDGFHLFPKEMLYDMENDPFEQKDVATQNPAVCNEGAQRLSSWHDEQMNRMAKHSINTEDPLWTVMRENGPLHANIGPYGQPGGIAGFNKYLKRLEETGRAEGAKLLREKYLPSPQD